MPVATETQVHTETSTRASHGSLKLRTEAQPAWLADLHKNGYVVVPNVVPEAKATEYASRAYDWVEKLGMGYKRDDPSTRTLDKLHFFKKGGLTNRYGVAHEQFIWDLKQEPAIIAAFETIWSTPNLFVSFDGCNISIPIIDRAPTDDAFQPWAHVDQSPLVPGLNCVQGIVNLLPNGPEDGGLMVLKGSSALYSELFAAFDAMGKTPEGGWNTKDRHDHSQEELEWLYARGCTWEKVCARPGDLLLWDSRTVHYGATPTAENDRIAVYCCYTPAAFADDPVRTRRAEAWERKLNSSHNPNSFWIVERDVPPEHPTHELARTRPLQEPVLSKRGRQLVGLEAY